MRQNRGAMAVGLFFVLVGCLGLAVNFGYLRFSIEMVAMLPLFFGCMLLISVFAGSKDSLFPALLFIFISVPLYLTLAGFSGQHFWPLWILAPGLSFLGASLQGGAWRSMAVPGTIVSAVGLFFLGQEWWGLDWHLVMSVGLVIVGLLLLLPHRSRES